MSNASANRRSLWVGGEVRPKHRNGTWPTGTKPWKIIAFETPSEISCNISEKDLLTKRENDRLHGKNKRRS